MAPRRRKTRPGGVRKEPQRARAGIATSDEEAIPEAFRELLAGVDDSHEPGAQIESRPLKRRRIGDARPEPVIENAFSSPIGSEDNAVSQRLPQTITLESSDSDESEFEWEDVDIEGEDTGPPMDAVPTSISVVIGEKPSSKRRPGSARPAITAAFRKMRLDVHKMHVCCLLYHNFLRNSYCNDPIAQVCCQFVLESCLYTKKKARRICRSC